MEINWTSQLLLNQTAHNPESISNLKTFSPCPTGEVSCAAQLLEIQAAILKIKSLR